MEAHHDDETLLTPSEVAAMFRVNPKTVTRWARAGKISAIRTLGGHRRFSRQRDQAVPRQRRRGRPHLTCAPPELHALGALSSVAGTGVDPVTSRFSGARSAN